MKEKFTKSVLERKRALKGVIRREKNLRELGSRLNEKYMENGKARIDVDLTDAELYTPLSRGKQRQLNGDIFDHIEQSANLLPSLVPLRIVFYGMEPDPEEQARVRELYQRHYSAAMQDRLWDQRSNTHRMLYMILIGVAFLALYLVLALNREDSLFLELLSVIGSFSLWEAASCFLVERKAIQKELMETAQFMTAEIAFSDAKEQYKA